MEQKRKRRSFNLKMIQEEAIKRGGQCLANKYMNSTYKLLFECGEGHRFRATPLEIMGKKGKKGKWCPKCGQGNRPF